MDIKTGVSYEGSKKKLPSNPLINLDSISPEQAETIAYKAANKFISSLGDNQINLESIKILSELGFHNNQEISRRTLEPMFGVVINDLKKSFKKREGEAYLKIMPHFILKAKEKSKIIHNWSKKMNLSSENPLEDIYERNKKLRKKKNPLSIEERDRIKKVILLSRNTIGSEAYINGIIIHRLLKNLKNAEIVFIDTSNTGKHIFNNPRIKLIDKFTNSKGDEISLSWDRQEISILDRFEYTAKLSEFIEFETKDLKKGEFIVFDADTRLSQTGAMPICPEESHYFIDTVLDENEPEIDKIENFGILCNKYLNGIFNENEMTYPSIFLSEEDKDCAREFRKNLPKDKPIILLHFGSGLKFKTLSPEFEKKLALSTFDFGIPLIVKPPIEWEEKKVEELINFLNENGKKENKDFYTFKGPLSTFVSLIGEMDLCIGYDSQCQHMAAALEIPFITLFTGHINKIFLKRWTPISKNFSRIIEVDKNQGDYINNQFRQKLESFAIQEAISTLNEFKRLSQNN